MVLQFRSKVLKFQKFGSFKKGQGRGPILKQTVPLNPPFYSLQAILSMLQDMNFINNYKIDCPTLARCVPQPSPPRAGSPGLCLPLFSTLTSIAPAFWEGVSVDD